jgi:hypothetical protein
VEAVLYAPDRPSDAAIIAIRASQSVEDLEPLAANVFREISREEYEVYRNGLGEQIDPDGRAYISPAVKEAYWLFVEMLKDDPLERQTVGEDLHAVTIFSNGKRQSVLICTTGSRTNPRHFLMGHWGTRVRSAEQLNRILVRRSKPWYPLWVPLLALVVSATAALLVHYLAGWYEASMIVLTFGSLLTISLALALRRRWLTVWVVSFIIILVWAGLIVLELALGHSH